jgi:hypothetical protein
MTNLLRMVAFFLVWTGMASIVRLVTDWIHPHTIVREHDDDGGFLFALYCLWPVMGFAVIANALSLRRSMEMARQEQLQAQQDELHQLELLRAKIELEQWMKTHA